MNSNQSLGKVGETIALTFLTDQGYRLLRRNFYSHWGEIDLIVEKDRKVSFVEVKTRLGRSHGRPYESVNMRKMAKLVRPIKFFLLQNDFGTYKLSLDVISVELNSDYSIKDLKHYENVPIRI